jgi:CHAD domain-containing protein
MFLVMPFHFKRKEAVQKAVRRLCRERIVDALGALKKPDTFEAVHDIRKEIKKARAILRLVRTEIGNHFYKKCDRLLREAADCLTAARDADVKLSAFEMLTKHFNGKLSARPFPKIKKLVRDNCRDEARRFLKSDSIAKAKRILQKAKRKAGDLKMKSVGWRAIAPGLKKSFSSGREAYETALKDSTPKNFHEWRKRVKDLGFQIRLICPVWPKELRAVSDELEGLGELLGDDHDLAMLKEFIAEKFKRAGDVDDLNRLIRARQKELRSAALKLGVKFFAEAPETFCRRFGNHWKIWRNEAGRLSSCHDDNYTTRTKKRLIRRADLTHV